jgi:flagellar biosynthesis protein FlhA
LLTIGDGLVSQIPALVISTGAAMLVTRAASNDTLGTEVGRQVFLRARPMMMTGGILAALALVPGLPFLPFLLLGGAMGGVGLLVQSRHLEEKAEAQEKAGLALAAAGGGGRAKGALPASEKEKAKKIPPMSAVDLEIGFGLVPLVDAKQGGKLIERIGLVRGQLAEELGFVLPPVNVRDNMRLKNTEYCIRIRGVETVRGTVRPGFWMAICPPGGAKLEGFATVKEPAFGFDACWIPEDKKEQAETRGLTVVDCASVVTTHLAEIAKRHAADIVSRQDVSDMIDQLKESHPSVVQELIPNKFPIGGVHRVLQRLLRERVSVRDLSLVMECITDHVARTQDPGLLAEFCRKELGPHICLNYQAADGTLSALGLHPDAEALIKKSTRREANELGMLIMEPVQARALLDSLRTSLETARKNGHEPLVLCSPLVRPQFRYLIEHDFSGTAVLSFAEVPDSVSVNMVGMIQAPAVAPSKAEGILQEVQA